MSKVTVKANHAFVHNGEQIEEGEELTLHPKAAQTYANIDFVSMTKSVAKEVEAELSAGVVEEEVKKAPAKRRGRK